MGLDKLIDLIIKFIGLFQVWCYIDHFDAAVVLRRGLYNRTLKPGWRWLWPLSLEEVISVNVKTEPTYLDPQSLCTRDQYPVNLQIGYTFEVIHPRTYLLEYEDTDDIISLLLCGLVTEAVHTTTWNDIRDDSEVWLRNLKTRANRIAKSHGVRIKNIVIRDFASGSADRLWHEGIHLDLGEE